MNSEYYEISERLYAVQDRIAEFENADGFHDGDRGYQQLLEEEAELFDQLDDFNDGGYEAPMLDD